MRQWVWPASAIIGCLIGGLAISWLLFVILLQAPPSHVLAAVRYLAITGIISLLAGTMGILVIERYVPRLGLKIGIATIFFSAAAVINMIVTPLMMFKEHSDFVILSVTLLYFLIISLAFATLVATLTTRQVKALRQASARLAGGDFATRVPIHGSDEVAELVRAFNGVASELGASFARRRQLEQARQDLIAAVSHDLRTPLASIHAMIEAINDGVVTDPEGVQRYLRLVQGETEQLGALIDDLFEVSRIESGTIELRLSSVPLDELVMETVEGLRVGAEDKGVAIEAFCQEAMPPLALDGPRIQRVLANLVENAIRHTPSGGSIRVEVAQTNGQVQLAVTDTGEGIALEDQPRVFDQFFRSEKSRSRAAGGAGLGLAIARGIVEAHHGSIRVESAPERGARFVVELQGTAPVRDAASG